MKVWKRIVALLCILSLCQGIYAQAAPESLDDFPLYEDGDVVGVIGDSITHVQYGSVSYVEALYYYYLCRFPERKIEFRNIGTANCKASDILNIYDQDPAFRGINKAIIMLGMNEALLKLSTEEYIDGMEEIIGRLKQDGLAGEDILVLAPTPYDDMCALNYDRKGNPYRLIDHLLTDFTVQLAEKAKEWGIRYLDLHTPMLELSEEIQKENPKNTLTRGDCIHPSIIGQRIMAYYILQMQGAEELKSGISVPSEGEARSAGGEITDFYRGEKGVSWILKQETLPAALTEDFLEYLDFFAPAFGLYQQPLQVAGLTVSMSYHVYMGETELGSFTGKELEDGVNLAMLEMHPLQETTRQLDDMGRQLHQKAMTYRAMWIDAAAGQASYSEDEIREAYDSWRAEDVELRDEMYALAQEAIDDTVFMAVVEDGYSLQELEQEKLEAIRAAGIRIISESQEKIRGMVVVRAKGRTLGLAGKFLLLIIAGIFLVAAVLGLCVNLSKKKRKKKFKRGHSKKR